MVPIRKQPMSKRRRSKPEDEPYSLKGREITLICEHCDHGHVFESIDAANLMEGIVTCDNCGKPFIREGLEKIQALMETMKTNPEKLRKLGVNVAALERLVRKKFRSHED
jgi:transcription elongation factor Elf1